MDSNSNPSMPTAIKSKNAVIAFFLFLVWPFFSFIFAMLNWRKDYAKTIFILFSGFVGYTFFISGGDCKAYYEIFLDIHANVTYDLFEFLYEIYLGNLGRGDYYNDLLSYLVSRVTGDYRVLFAVFGLIFGYFYANNVWFVLDKCKGRLKFVTIIFFALLILLNPFWGINAVRFYTAVHVFIYGLIMYNETSKKRYWIYMLSCSLIHLTFAIPFGLYLLFIILGDRKYVFLLILLLGFVLKDVEVPAILNLLPQENLPQAAQGRIKGYTHETIVLSYIENFKALNWYVVWKLSAVNYLSVFCACFVLFTNKLKNSKINKLNYFGIIMLSFSYMVDIIPAMDRFYMLGHFPIFMGFIIYIQNYYHNTKLLSILTPIFLFPILLYCAVECRMAFDVLSTMTFIGNPLFAPFFANDIPLIDFLK